MSHQRDDGQVELSADEKRLVRLFRCLRDDEKNDILVNIGRELVQRHLVDTDDWPPDSDPSVEDALRYERPLNWPNPGEVDMDNLGDPGAYLDEVLDNTEDLVLGAADPDTDAGVAEALMDIYLERQSEMYFPLSTEFGATQEEMEEDIRASFHSFLREWREQVVQAVEQSRQQSGGILEPETVSPDGGHPAR